MKSSLCMYSYSDCYNPFIIPACHPQLSVYVAQKDLSRTRVCVRVTDIWCNEAKVIYKMHSLDTHMHTATLTRRVAAHRAVKRCFSSKPSTNKSNMFCIFNVLMATKIWLDTPEKSTVHSDEQSQDLRVEAERARRTRRSIWTGDRDAGSLLAY